MTACVDGLITNAADSPFTTAILPYVHVEHPDRTVEWNVSRFDQGTVNTRAQLETSFCGDTVRCALALAMEHAFMTTREGVQNFQDQVRQLVETIQTANDVDVHVALVAAPKYLAQARARCCLGDYFAKAVRDYADAFGLVQKKADAMDTLVEDAKCIIKGWGGAEPDFMLCSSQLCARLATASAARGADGQKLPQLGPTVDMFRGLKIARAGPFRSAGTAPHATSCAAACASASSTMAVSRGSRLSSCTTRTATASSC